MKLETRIFKHARFLILTPENDLELARMQDVLGEKDDTPIKGVITSDDNFQPYLRLEKGTP